MAPTYLQELLWHHQPARYLRSSSDKWRFAEQHYNLNTYICMGTGPSQLQHREIGTCSQ